MDSEGGNHEAPRLHSSNVGEVPKWLSILGSPSKALDNRAFDVKFWSQGFLLPRIHLRILARWEVLEWVAVHEVWRHGRLPREIHGRRYGCDSEKADRVDTPPG